MRPLPTAERRKQKRIRLDASQVTVQSDNRMSCRIADISRVGASAKVDVPVPEMSMVKLEIHLGGTNLPKIEIDCQAAVVRSKPIGPGEYEIGLFFLDLDDTTREAIDAYIEAFEKLDGSGT